MYKAKLGKQEKEILLELLKLMSEVDGNVTHDEMDMIYQVKRLYKIKDYEYKNYTRNDIRRFLVDMNEQDVLNILTHATILGLEDGIFSKEEKDLIKSFFDLLSLESAGKMQNLIDKHGKSDYDVKELFNQSNDEEIVDESITMMKDFSNRDASEIDEGLLMKMKRGPIKKVWEHVMHLWTVVNDPTNDKAVKAIAIGALLYLILPVDTIPDLIPVLGLTDDVTVITFAISNLAKHYGIGKKMNNE